MKIFCLSVYVKFAPEAEYSFGKRDLFGNTSTGNHLEEKAGLYVSWTRPSLWRVSVVLGRAVYICIMMGSREDHIINIDLCFTPDFMAASVLCEFVVVEFWGLDEERSDEAVQGRTSSLPVSLRGQFLSSVLPTRERREACTCCLVGVVQKWTSTSSQLSHQAADGCYDEALVQGEPYRLMLDIWMEAASCISHL